LPIHGDGGQLENSWLLEASLIPTAQKNVSCLCRRSISG